VFEGLCREEDEPKRGVGWRCYCGVPDRSYSEEGDQRPPRPKKVYLVFVNADRVAYNWRWEFADDRVPQLLRNPKTRFKRRIP